MGNRMGRALRRGTALGLVLTAAWAVSLTADISALGEGLSALGGGHTLAVSLMTSQLGPLPGQREGVTGWGRLLVDNSPLLAAGEEAVTRRLDEPAPPGPPVPDGSLPSDGDDEEEPDLQPPRPEDGIVEMTGQGKEGSQYLSDGGVYVYNRTDLALDSSLLQEGTVDVPLGEGPQILIVHTHGSEAYSMTPPCATTPPITGPTAGPRRWWSSGWPSTPPSRWCWTFTGTPWWAATGRFTRWYPPRPGRRWPR